MNSEANRTKRKHTTPEGTAVEQPTVQDDPVKRLEAALARAQTQAALRADELEELQIKRDVPLAQLRAAEHAYRHSPDEEGAARVAKAKRELAELEPSIAQATERNALAQQALHDATTLLEQERVNERRAYLQARITPAALAELIKEDVRELVRLRRQQARQLAVIVAKKQSFELELYELCRLGDPVSMRYDQELAQKLVAYAMFFAEKGIPPITPAFFFRPHEPTADLRKAMAAWFERVLAPEEG